MADDVVEHLASADVLEDHVIVVLVDDHLSHAADVRVVEEHGQRRLAESADLLRSVLRCLLGGRFRGGRTGGGVRGYAGQYLDGQLWNEEASSSIRTHRRTRGKHRDKKRGQYVPTNEEQERLHVGKCMQEEGGHDKNVQI